MSAMKDRVAALCEQLGVEQSGSGLAPAVRLCAAAAGMTYETIAKTRGAPAAAVKREPSAAAAATPAAPAARKRPRDEDDDFELTKVLSPAERAESMEKAKKDGAVQDIDDDDEDEPAPKAPPAKKQRLVPGPGGCTCKILAAGGNYTSRCQAPSYSHECLCKGETKDPSSCRADSCPCTCKALLAAGKYTSGCRARPTATTASARRGE
ncbi:hypothetical protein JL721_12578 [Aureococcus anophagefferens]|nr:hypothetical protein JL721_12578 [Aureococcus anophagefferens]